MAALELVAAGVELVEATLELVVAALLEVLAVMAALLVEPFPDVLELQPATSTASAAVRDSAPRRSGERCVTVQPTETSYWVKIG